MKKLVNIFKRINPWKIKDIPLNDSEFIKNICKFTVNECVVGDYYEFGVYRGQTLISFYFKLMQVASKRIKNTGDTDKETQSLVSRKKIKENTIFHAFDSFEGLPTLSDEDNKSNDFAKGQYSAGINVVKNLAKTYGMPQTRINFHKGWFSETCTKDYFLSNSLKPASIIWLDCDLYSSAKDALNLIKLIIQDGTMIIIDDWYCFKGHPDRGVQKAWHEFMQLEEVQKEFKFSEYQNNGWARKSFIVNKIENI